MAAYSVRIEMRGYPTSTQYDQLHELMSEIGFEREFESERHGRLKLPHGEYVGNTRVGPRKLLDHLANLVGSVHPNAGITLYPYDGFYYSNLEEV